ncbi:MAG: histidine kinase [Micropruina sp.]
MIGTATPRLDEAMPSRPLRVVRALVLVVIGVDLISGLFLTWLATPWLYTTVMVLSAIGAALSLFRPMAGLVVCLVPIVSALWAPVGQDAAPLLVTTVMICAVASARTAWIVMLGYLGYAVASWVFNGPHRGLAVLVLLVVATGVGLAVRMLWRRNGRMNLRIRRLQAQTLRLRAAERATLAEELSQLLVNGLRDGQRDLAEARTGTDAAELSGVLERADATARGTLAQLRGLVSTLRGRSGEPLATDSRPEDLLGVAEEVEELLVGHGYPTAIELPDRLPGVGDFARQLLATILREAGTLMVRQAPAGESCAIAVTLANGRLGVELSHPGAGAGTADGALRAAEHRMLAAGGSFEIDHRDGWRLRAALPVLVDATAEPLAAPPASAPGWRRRGLRRPAALSVLAVALVLAVHAVLGWSAGTDDWTWRAAWSLAVAGLAACTWRLRYAVVLMLAVLLVSLLGVEPSLVVGQPAQLAIIVLAAIGVVHRARWAWIVTLGWAIYCLIWFHSPSPQPAADGVFYPIIGAMLGLATQHFQRLLNSSDRRLASAASRHDAARDDVRRELAGELHDIVAHQLSLITMQAGAYRGETDPAGLRVGIDRVAAINASAQADLALLLHVMRAPVSAQPDADAGWLSPTAAAAAAVGTMREAGHQVRTEVDARVDGADPTTRKTAARIVREATTNILRYAPHGAECSIRMVPNGDLLELTVENPLPDRPRLSPHSTGLGLFGLEERARITGGTFSAGPSGGRWQVAAQLPLKSQVDLRPRAEDERQLGAEGSESGSTMPSWIPRIRI